MLDIIDHPPKQRTVNDILKTENAGYYLPASERRMADLVQTF
jgi:hypothetical protein